MPFNLLTVLATDEGCHRLPWREGTPFWLSHAAMAVRARDGVGVMVARATHVYDEYGSYHHRPLSSAEDGARLADLNGRFEDTF